MTRMKIHELFLESRTDGTKPEPFFVIRLRGRMPVPFIQAVTFAVIMGDVMITEKRIRDDMRTPCQSKNSNKSSVNMGHL